MGPCSGCRFQQIPKRARLTEPAFGRMSAVEFREREKDLQMVRAAEERENFDARQHHMLGYVPHFFAWCSIKTFPDDPDLRQKRAARSQEIVWYRLCQIENSDETCALHSERQCTPELVVAEQAADPEFRVTLGTRMELVRTAVSPASLPTSQIASERTYWGDSGGARNGSPQTEPVEIAYKLQPTQQPIALSGKADSLCFGFFGAPGSGKTTLMMRMLEQILAYENGSESNGARRFGALILDPKTALVTKVRRCAQSAGRSHEDVIVLGSGEMNSKGVAAPRVNVLNCVLHPEELGKFLSQIARSAGSKISEMYWLDQMGEVLGATLLLLGASSAVRKPSLRNVLNTILDTDREGIPLLKKLLEKAKSSSTPQASTSWRMAIAKLERFYSDSKTVTTVSSVLSTAFGAFQRDDFACFSNEVTGTSLYDSILKDGKVVVISQSGLDAGAAKVLCTLVKCLFQRAVLGRTEEESKEGRPVVLVCDEYGQIATELEGESGDGEFFALAREKKCMGLLAAQSVHTLETSSLGKNWRSVYSNFSAKFFMRCADPETAQEACNLAGKSDWEMLTRSFQTNGESTSFNESVQRQTRDHLLPRQFLGLKTGQAFAVGMLDGVSEAVFTFMQAAQEEKR